MRCARAGGDAARPIAMPPAVMISVWRSTSKRVAAPGAEGHADADLRRALRDRVAHDAVDPDEGQGQGQPGERRQQDQVEPRTGVGLIDHVPHRLGLGHRGLGIQAHGWTARSRAPSRSDRRWCERRGSCTCATRTSAPCRACSARRGDTPRSGTGPTSWPAARPSPRRRRSATRRRSGGGCACRSGPAPATGAGQALVDDDDAGRRLVSRALRSRPRTSGILIVSK